MPWNGAAGKRSNLLNNHRETEMSEELEEIYACVGVCMSDPETGYCMGCGRPPMGGPDVAIEIVLPPAHPLDAPE